MNGSSNASQEGSRSAVGNVREERFLELSCGYGQAGREKAVRESALSRMLHETERVYRKVFRIPRCPAM